MRVPSNHFRGDTCGHLVEIEIGRLFKHSGHEKNVKEDVPQFLTDGFGIVGLDGVYKFVGLFDEINGHGSGRLFPVPGTSVLTPQGSHQLV